MQLRKALTLGAAVLATVLLTTTATASSPTGGPIANLAVNGSTAAGTAPINGTFKSGMIGTSLCTAGTVAGVAKRGTRPATGHDFMFSTFTLVCPGPLGSMTISVSPGCTIDSDFGDGNVHDGTLDTGTGPKFSRVDGLVPAGDGTVFYTNGCARVTALGGFCTAWVSGPVNTFFDEAITTSGGVSYQTLILDGAGLAYSNQSGGCSGLMAGSITLNNITYNIEVTGGTTTGIDFRQT